VVGGHKNSSGAALILLEDDNVECLSDQANQLK